jgi:homoserine kinase type II
MSVEYDQKTLLDQIKHSLQHKFDMRVDSATPIAKGHLNAKWKIDTNKGAWFVKSYNLNRYRKYEPQIWLEIEVALKMNALLHSMGGACPALLSIRDGAYIQTTAEGQRYVVMGLCEGRTLEPGAVHADQMRSLGAAAALMHQVWNDSSNLAHGEGSGSTIRVALWPISRQEMEKTWEQRWSCAAEKESQSVRSALLLQREVISRLDDSCLADGAPGWTHLDLWVDNLLFHDNELAAIVDFDRVRYAYPRMDLGRAILSCAVRHGEFQEEIIAAFAEGYRSNRQLPKGSLLQAVRHIWCVESFWWLHAGMEKNDPVTDRFVNEMLWTAKQWDGLEGLLGEL